MKKTVSVLSELLPLVIFLVLYKKQGIITATYGIVITSISAVAINYIVNRQIKMQSIIALVILTLFGGLTIYSKNADFIKLKPTIINLIFAAILLGGLYKKIGLLKYVLGEAITMSEDSWCRLSFRFGLFFLFLAGLNEIVWRGFSEASWVAFKVYGLLPLMLGFTFSQTPFISRNQLDNSNQSNEN